MNNRHTATEIKLHQKSQLLEISFSTGDNFKLPCEYLRTHARSAEIETSDTPVSGKADVNITKIEPQGNYALRLFFDDGYDSGIFPWDTLFELGEKYKDNWASYLAQLEKFDLTREPANKTSQGDVNIHILYFMTNMLKVTKKETEDLKLPESIRDIQSLLKLLRFRGEDWKNMFADDTVQVTVNKQFAELFTKLEDGDEVAFVPVSKDI